jgi:hypothetical protein
MGIVDGRRIEPGAASVVTQILAAEVVEFIRQSRADTQLYRLMTTTLPSSIYFIPHDRLRDLRVVTDNILDEQWPFEFEDGVPFLQIWQQSTFGENKLLLMCDKEKLAGAAFIEPPTHAIGATTHSVGIFINGNFHAIPDQLMLRHPRFRGKFASATFQITPDMADQMLGARSIGTANQPLNNDVFFGFQIGTAKGYDKLTRMLRGCRQR